MRRWIFCVWMILAFRAQAESDLRLTLGGGYGVGSNSGVYDVNHGSLDLQAVTGGSGPVLTAGLWLDHVMTPRLSVGVDFLRLMNKATATLDLPKGISILTDPTSGQAKLSANGDMAFLDVAYRPVFTDPAVAFYVGGGIGGGTGKAGASFEIFNPATGGFSQQASVNSAIGGAHGLMGVDFYLTKSMFISLSPQILYITGHPVGVHQSYLDMIFTSSIGIYLD